MSKRFEIKIELVKKDLWKSALENYFSFDNLFYSYLGFSIFGLGLSLFFLREKFLLSHFADTILTAILFTAFYNLAMTYFFVSRTENIIGNRYYFIFTDEEIAIDSDEFRIFVKWKHIPRVKEGANYFVLYMKSGQRQIIPKRCFQDNELSEFKNLLLEKIGTEAYLKKAKGNLGLK